MQAAENTDQRDQERQARRTSHKRGPKKEISDQHHERAESEYARCSYCTSTFKYQEQAS